MKTPDNFDWDFEKAVRETKDEMYTNNNNNNNEVFAFEFIEKCKEMFEREELEAKKRDEKEKEDNERYARERREKQKHMSEDDSKMKAAIFKDHLVSWKHEGDPKVTPLLETELAADVRKRFKSHPIVCYEKCRFQRYLPRRYNDQRNQDSLKTHHTRYQSPNCHSSKNLCIQNTERRRFQRRR